MVPPARQVVRTVLTVVCVAIALYLLYLLRKPIGWVLVAAFLAVALSPPVNALSKYMRRGLAITVVYLGLLAGLAGYVAARAFKAGSPPAPKMAIEEARLIRETVASEHPEATV